MKACWTALVLSGALIVGAASVDAAWWNPITKTSRSSMPLVNGRPLQSSASMAPTGPSLAKRMQTGTKKVVDGTVDLITLKPIREAMAPSKPAPKTTYGTAQPWNPGATKQPKKTGPFSFVGNMFKSKEPEQPRTMQEFLAQPRPGDTKK